MFSVISCIRDHHDWRLVVAAVVVCLTGNLTAMLLLFRAQQCDRSSAQDFDLGRCSGKSLGYLQWSDVFAGTAQHSNRAAAKPERDRGAGKECCGIAAHLI